MKDDRKKSLLLLIANVRPDLESSIEVFNLIVQYEKGKYEILPNIVKSVRKRLHFKKQSNEIVNTLLDFFEKTSFGEHSKQELREQFMGLKRNVNAAMKQAKEILLLDGFDVVSWIDSKIENKSFAEVVREKAEERAR